MVMPSEDLLPPRAAACVLYVFLLLTLVVQRVRAQPPLSPSVPTYATLPLPKGELAEHRLADRDHQKPELAEWELAELRAVRERQYRNLDLTTAHVLAPPRLDAAELPWAKRIWRDIPLVGCLSDSLCHPDSLFASQLLLAVEEGHLPGAYTTGVDGLPVRLRVREDWVWDGGHGTMRMVLSGIGLAAGPRSGDLILWVPIAAARPWLAHQTVGNAPPERLGWSWYDALTMQVFAGQIMRISHPSDLDLVDRASGETLQEASDQIDAWLQRREAYYWEDPMPRASP